MNASNLEWLPKGYSVPKTSSGYMKMKDGENRIRILSKPITGWLDWENQKPLRFREDKKPPRPKDIAKPIKHFMAFIVWNYGDEQIQILELTQVTIKNAILSLCTDSDWGVPCFYDIKIMKSGQSKDTEYVVNPIPHKPISDHIIEAFHQRKIRLDSLYEGLDPFKIENNQYTPGMFELKQVQTKQPSAFDHGVEHIGDSTEMIVDHAKTGVMKINNAEAIKLLEI